MHRSIVPVPVIAATLLACACAPEERSGEPSLRLVDRFTSEAVTDAAPSQEPPPRVEWTFDDDDSRTWSVHAGIDGATLRDGRVEGRSTSEFPVLRLDWEADIEPDVLHAVEIRMRSSEAGEMSVGFAADEEAIPATLGRMAVFPWSKTPLVAGEEPTSYFLTGPFPAPSGSTRHVLLRPGVTAGAELAIDSVRLVFRREHLAGFPTGVGWQPLAEIYRETLVARTPETLRFEVDLPTEPLLDLTIGTPQKEPVTFRVRMRTQDGEELALERTVSTPDRWEPWPIDLDGWGGRPATVELTLAGEPGTIGFWGSPAFRRRGVEPERAAWTGPGEGVEPPTGVILIMVDTLRPDHLDAYGYDRATAPALAEMAEDGVRFEKAWAQATWTKVSGTSILTGLYPSSHGVAEFPDRLPAAATTLAEVYRDAGYATLSFSSVLFTGKFTNLHQGFEAVHEFTSVGEEVSAKTARAYVDRLLPWLEAHRETPFFVFLHLFDPHDPFEPYAPWDTRWFDPEVRAAHLADLEATLPHVADPLRAAFGMPTESELEAAGVDPGLFNQRQIDWYDGSIRGFDVELGRLRQRLAELGLADDTLLVFVSDHGEEFLDHGRSFHGQSVYGELARVPMIVAWPGTVTAGRTVDADVQTIDILPTVLGLSRLPVPEGAQGRDLSPFLLAGDWRAPRSLPALTERAAVSDGGGNPPPGGEESFALVHDGWKLVHNTIRPDGRPEHELYDVAADPLDQHDVAADHPEIVARMAEQLAAVRERAAAALLPEDDAAEGTMSVEELERLRSLGYIQ